MSIQLKLSSEQSFLFSERRIERVINADTLDSACEMGMWDKIKDFFQGHVKRDAIADLFNYFGAQTSKTTPLDILKNFECLRALASDQHKEKFTVLAKKDSNNNTWFYSLHISEHTIFRSSVQQDSFHSSYKDFYLGKVDMDLRGHIQRELNSNDLHFTEKTPHTMLSNFETYITRYANMEEGRSKFSVAIRENLEGETWSYSLLYKDVPVFSSSEIKETPKTSRFSFCASKVAMDMRLDFLRLRDTGLGLSAYIQAGVETASGDDDSTKKEIMENLDNPKYGRSYFVATDYFGDRKDVFCAKFQDGSLMLDNRSGTLGEFRSTTLAEALYQRNYKNLRDFFSTGHNTKDDSLLGYFCRIYISTLVGLLDLDSPKSIQQDPRLVNTLNKELIANIAIGQLWGIPQTNTDSTKPTISEPELHHRSWL